LSRQQASDARVVKTEHVDDDEDQLPVNNLRQIVLEAGPSVISKSDEETVENTIYPAPANFRGTVSEVAGLFLLLLLIQY
jgi:hypothetical protein